MSTTDGSRRIATGFGPMRVLAGLLCERRTGAVVVLASGGFLLLVAVPADLIDTPMFSRALPPTWWAWPALVVSSVLGGLVAATYVRPVDQDAGGPEAPEPDDAASGRGGMLAGLLTFFAVGCPVCNKLVLLALGATGAVTWFEPFQPVLQTAALALLGWALVRRLRNRSSCRVSRGRAQPPVAATPTPTSTP